jgi:hypothetical protein
VVGCRLLGLVCCALAVGSGWLAEGWSSVCTGVWVRRAVFATVVRQLLVLAARGGILAAVLACRGDDRSGGKGVQHLLPGWAIERHAGLGLWQEGLWCHHSPVMHTAILVAAACK